MCWMYRVLHISHRPTGNSTFSSSSFPPCHGRFPACHSASLEQRRSSASDDSVESATKPRRRPHAGILMYGICGVFIRGPNGECWHLRWSLALLVVVYLPLWTIWKSMGRIISYIMDNKKCLKPPTRLYIQLTISKFEPHPATAMYRTYLGIVCSP